MEAVDNEPGEPAEARDAESVLPSWASLVDSAEPADALAFHQPELSEPQLDADEPRDVDPGMTTYQPFPTFGAEAHDATAPFEELPFERDEPDNLSVWAKPWAAGTVDASELTPLTDDVEDPVDADVDLGPAFAAEATTAEVEAYNESPTFSTGLDEGPISDPAQSFDSQAGEVEDEPDGARRRLPVRRTCSAGRSRCRRRGRRRYDGRARRSSVEPSAVEPTKSKKKLKARGDKAARGGAKSSGRSTQMVGVRAGSSQIVAAVRAELGLDPRALAARECSARARDHRRRRGARARGARGRAQGRSSPSTSCRARASGSGSRATASASACSRLPADRRRQAVRERDPVPRAGASPDPARRRDPGSRRARRDVRTRTARLLRVLIAFAHRELVDRYVERLQERAGSSSPASTSRPSRSSALSAPPSGNGATPTRRPWRSPSVRNGRSSPSPRDRPATSRACSSGAAAPHRGDRAVPRHDPVAGRAHQAPRSPSMETPVSPASPPRGSKPRAPRSGPRSRCSHGSFSPRSSSTSRGRARSPIGELLLTGGGSELGGLPASSSSRSASRSAWSTPSST